MKVHQLSVTYLPEQDRLLVRINTTDAEELRLWFTRRLMLGLWPTLHQVMVDHLLKTEPSVTSGAAADAAMKQMLADFRKEEFLRQADFDTPYDEARARLPLGEEPLLVTDVNITPQPGDLVALEFTERPPGEGTPRSFRLDLDPQLMQGMLFLVEQALQQADWQLPTVPVAVAAPPENDGLDTIPSIPIRYLN